MFTPRKIANTYREMINSIGFYPSVLSVSFLILATITVSIEYTSPISQLKEQINVLLVDSEENARTILSTLAGSVISLTVFSFSMVMVVLNTASANLSPRVIPGLITKKSHQLVLGFYLGSIIYAIIMLINIKQMENYVAIPSLGVLISLIFGLISLGLFVYFIHSISKAIQVDNVLNDLFKHTKKEITGVIDRQKSHPIQEFPEFESWHSIESATEGYFKGFNSQRLCEILAQEKLKIYVVVNQGYFTVKGYPFLKCDTDLSDKPELIEKLLNCFIFYIEEYISDHYRYGLTQISEIAVKAMSPGINDPGTAVKAIDMLSILLIERLKISDINYSFKHANKYPLLYLHETSFEELLHDNFTPLRNYAKTDAYVMTNILEAFKNILFTTHENEQATVNLFNYLAAIVDDINEQTSNQYDRNEVINMLKSIQRISPNKGEILLKRFTDKG